MDEISEILNRSARPPAKLTVRAILAQAHFRRELDPIILAINAEKARRNIIQATDTAAGDIVKPESIGMLKNKLPLKPAGKSFGCLMASLPSLDSDLPNWAAEHIPADQLAEDGIESEPHCTVLYGFNGEHDAAAMLAELPSIAGAFSITLGKVSRFECAEYDVIKLGVTAPDVKRLHDLLSQKYAGTITPSEHAFNPHVTIAYVQKGACKELDGNADFNGRELQCTQLLFSAADESRSVIDLSSAIQARAIRADDDSLRGEAVRQDEARRSTEKKYRDALRKAAAIAEANAHEEKHDKAALALILLLFIGAARAAYLMLWPKLQAMAWTKAQCIDDNLAGQLMPAINVHELNAAATAFAKVRGEILTPLAKELVVAVHGAMEDTEAPEALADAVESIIAEHETEVAETESQAVYGAVQIEALKLAGFTHKFWRTMDDERVRESHDMCEQQGPIKLGSKFHNHLAYPGDPAGPPEEVINCRCWLEGVGRVVPVKASSAYGSCPQCGAEVIGRTRGGKNAKDTCANGHTYLACESIQASGLNFNWDDFKHPHDDKGHWAKTYAPQSTGYKNPHSQKVHDAIRQLSSWKTPVARPVAGAVVVNHEGKILLGKSTFGGQGWFFPKGGIDEGESIEAAAAREALEETGVDVGVPVTETPIPIAAQEKYGDSLGFGSPRTQHKDPSLPISAGAAQLIKNAAAKAGLTDAEHDEHRDAIYDDLARSISVSWASQPNYHMYAVRGEPGHPTDEVSEIKWATPEEARKLPGLHMHAKELVNHPHFDTLVEQAKAHAPAAPTAEDFGFKKASGSLGKLGYYHSSDPAVIVSAQVSDDKIFLTRMEAVTKGQGDGAKAMDRLKQFATATGRTIELTAGADTFELQPRLNAFYEKRGFVKMDNEAQPSYAWSPSSVKASDHTKFHGNQYVDIPGTFKVMTDALAHFKLVKSGQYPVDALVGKHLLASRVAFKSIPADHPDKSKAAALGADVVAHGLKAGVKYLGGGQVSIRPDKVHSPAIVKMTKPAVDLQVIKIKKAGNTQPAPKDAPNEAQGAPIGQYELTHATPLTKTGRAINAGRATKAAVILADGTAKQDAVLDVIASGDQSKLDFVKSISTGPMAARALVEFKDTPRKDLEVLSQIDVSDGALKGQAVCWMNTRKLGMGSTSVTGDFRHELGHAIHAAMMGSPLNDHIQKLHAETLAKVKANPAGIKAKLTHEFYETTYGVIGRRALDNDKENVAEHYRGYHKAVYRTRTGEDEQALAKYRERFPGWAKLWDAWYTQ